MEKKTFQVPNIGCDGCVTTVENTVSKIAGVQFVKADANTKAVNIEWTTPATWTEISTALTEIDYAPAD